MGVTAHESRVEGVGRRAISGGAPLRHNTPLARSKKKKKEKKKRLRKRRRRMTTNERCS